MSRVSAMAKTAIVTGCQGFIGRATCRELLEAGFVVVGVDRAPEKGDHEGPYITCDLSNIAVIEKMLETGRRYASDISLLVNNAGLYEPKGFFDLTLEDFDRVMTVNTRAVFLISQAVARWMVDSNRGGSIVNIASINGRLGSPIIPYGTSKAAVIGLTKSMARALAPHKIRVNAIAPGVIETPMSAAVAPEQMKRQLLNVPMGRMGEPSEIAKVVAFLAGDASSYMTGSIVDVNGGWPV